MSCDVCEVTESLENELCSFNTNSSLVTEWTVSEADRWQPKIGLMVGGSPGDVSENL